MTKVTKLFTNGIGSYLILKRKTNSDLTTTFSFLLYYLRSNRLFQFNGKLYEQTDGVAMGSPLGPLMANVFMCHLEEKLSRDGLMPDLYKRYVDDTLVKMPSTEAASAFLTTLNGLHPSMKFTMELPVSDKIPFIGIEILKSGTKFQTQVYRKTTNTGLLLHFHSHTDKRYKNSLLKTMLYRAYALSSTECDKLHSIFSRLDYPRALIDSTISNFLLNVSESQIVQKKTESSCKIRISLPFKDQVAANAVRKQFRDLSHKIGPTLQPIL